LSLIGFDHLPAAVVDWGYDTVLPNVVDQNGATLHGRLLHMQNFQGVSCEIVTGRAYVHAVWLEGLPAQVASSTSPLFKR
jgi:hypothetical protein